MNLKKDIPVLVFLILIMATAAAAAFILNVITGKMLEQSMIRAFAEPGRSAGGIARQIEGLDGVIRTETIEQDQAAAEFEAALGYPWPGADPLPGYADVIVEPGQAAAVLEHMEKISGIEYAAYHRDRMEQLADLVENLRLVQSLLLLLGAGAAVGLAWRAAAYWKRFRLGRAWLVMAVILSTVLIMSQAAAAQSPTELRQAYREAENALAKLQKEYTQLEKEAGGLEAEIAAEEENHAGKLSEQKQVEAALIQSDDEIDRLQQRIARIQQENREQSRHSGHALTRLQEAARLAAQGMVQHDAEAALFLDYLVLASGKAYAAADAGLRNRQIQEQELARQLKAVEQEREQLRGQLAQLKQEAGQIAKALADQKEKLTQVRQKLSAVQRMIYTQESRVWRGKRELRQKLGFTDFVWPLAVKGVVSSDYGLRFHPIFNEERFHTGVDLACESGVPIKAAADGTVVLSEDHGGYGLAVIIDHGGGVSTLYGHASRLLVQAGDRVKAGETIALVGSTGLSTGPHLHFEVRQDQQHVDPWIWLS